MLRGEVIASINRSNLRKRILSYLFDHSPEWSYPNEIARGVCSDPSNTTGALKGLGVRYNEEVSLIGLGLCEQKQVGITTFYRIKPEKMEEASEILMVFRGTQRKYVELEL